MNRREFLRTLGLAAAAVFTLPVTELSDGVLLGSKAPEEWHDLIRKYGSDITKDPQALAAAIEASRMLIQRKVEQGWRIVGVNFTKYGYSPEEDYSWLHVSYQMVRV